MLKPLQVSSSFLLPYAKLCKEAYDGIKVENHSFAVSDIPGLTIIAIAGTKNLENVLEDVSAWPVRTPTKALAHAGVMNGYHELEDAVIAHIPKDRSVVFTGHSLGGGIAQIFAEKFKTPVITFGALKTYFRFYPAPPIFHIRSVCDDDPVPYLPGLMYSQRCEAKVLKDSDGHFIEAKDHFIDTYIKRLQTEATNVG